jgi:2-hydroxy-3-keto-5-methylthiopentenyl-1-phosphate phosphatase
MGARRQIDFIRAALFAIRRFDGGIEIGDSVDVLADNIGHGAVTLLAKISTKQTSAPQGRRAQIEGLAQNREKRALLCNLAKNSNAA